MRKADLHEGYLLTPSNDNSSIKIRRYDPKNRNASKADLKGADLSGAHLSKGAINQADLTGAILNGADLSRAKLRDAKLTAATLRDANLSQADLSNANLIGADLTGANLTQTVLRDAELAGADLSDVDMSRAAMSRARMTRAMTDLDSDIQAILREHVQWINSFGARGGRAVLDGAIKALEDLIEGLRGDDIQIIDRTSDPAVAAYEETLSELGPHWATIASYEQRCPMRLYVERDRSLLDPKIVIAAERVPRCGPTITAGRWPGARRCAPSTRPSPARPTGLSPCPDQALRRPATMSAIRSSTNRRRCSASPP